MTLRPAGLRILSPRAWCQARAIAVAMELAAELPRAPDKVEPPKESPDDAIRRVTNARASQLIEVVPSRREQNAWH
jgi:hypothetical protein